MTEYEIKNHIHNIMRMRMPGNSRVELMQSFMEQQQREAFATGKAQAYKEMLAAIRKIAEKEKAENAVKAQPGRADDI